MIHRADDGWIEFAAHAGQLQAAQSDARIVAIVAGTQGGKTVIGSPWLLGECQRRGPGDYLIVTPSFQLLPKKVLPEFRNVFERLLGLGEYIGSPTKEFRFSAEGCRKLWGNVPDTPPRVIFGHAEDPETLESATVKACWADEAGQKRFRLASYEAIMRRLAVHQGRLLITTTPYDLGWLKQQLYDPWAAAKRQGQRHPEIEVINFESRMNPAFPAAEWERAQRTLPRWKFDMFYRGLFTRPAGLIYDCFDERIHKVKRFPIPFDWPTFLGLDFGGVHTAGVFLAKDPQDGKLYAYREYGPTGGRTAAGHAEAILRGELAKPKAVGGSKSEGQWRQEFGRGGLAVGEPPIHEVEVGIDRVYSLIQSGQLYVFEDLRGLLDELQSYSRKLNELGEPTEAIEAKETYHLLDSLRYIASHLGKPGSTWRAITPAEDDGNVVDRAPAGLFRR